MNGRGEIVLSELDRDDRAVVYERLAWLCEGTAVRVVWVSPFKHSKSCPGAVLDGYVLWNDGWEVRIATGLPVNREVNIFAHELAHVLLGHVRAVKLTPSELEGGLASNAVKYKDGNEAYTKQEQETDARAHKLIQQWEQIGLRQ